MIKEQIWFFCHVIIWWIAIAIITDPETWRSKNWKEFCMRISGG